MKEVTTNDVWIEGNDVIKGSYVTLEGRTREGGDDQ